jgi:hypothetical protein
VRAERRGPGDSEGVTRRESETESDTESETERDKDGTGESVHPTE